MATNTNKRTAIKHVRDGIKSQYKKASNCAICGTVDELELHHYVSVSQLLKQYSSERGIPIGTDEQVLAMRDMFYKDHWHELVEYTVTLCNTHHKKLHDIYGPEPLMTTAAKQEQWVLSQHNKFKNKKEGIVSPKKASLFSSVKVNK